LPDGRNPLRIGAETAAPTHHVGLRRKTNFACGFNDKLDFKSLRKK
jgi:hypothetical protein